MHKQIKVGSIVVVEEGMHYGHLPGAVTKVAAKPGVIDDKTSSFVGTRNLEDYRHVIMCEDMTSNTVPKSTYLNKPVLYEQVRDLRPATESEKEIYRLIKKHKR